MDTIQIDYIITGVIGAVLVVGDLGMAIGNPALVPVATVSIAAGLSATADSTTKLMQ